MPIQINNLKDKPMIRLDRLDRKYLLSEDAYDCLMRHLGEPLELQSIDHLRDGSVFSVTVYMPETIASYTALIYEDNKAVFTLL